MKSKIYEGLGPQATLGYCTNVHPTCSAQDILQMMRTECSQVGERVDPSINFGIGLWLSAARLKEFQAPELLESLQSECGRFKAKAFSWNAFPYLDFHQEQVKERVYQPDWTESARFNYTVELMTFIARLGLGNQEVSISTLPIAGKLAALDDSALHLVVAYFVQVILHSVEIEQKYGITIHLDLEPEPFCFLETSQDAVRFFKEYLLPIGSSQLEKQLGLSRDSAEQLILNKIRICYDTCHAAVMFETPLGVIKNYEKLGIQIGKVQISSGLVFNPKQADYRVLQALSQDRYLHQVVGKPSGQSSEFYTDLQDALLGWEKREPISDEYRIHYHVPVFMKKLASLSTTQDHILDLLKLAQTSKITNHWEVETYTWSVLPSIYRSGELSELISREINWVHQMSQC